MWGLTVPLESRLKYLRRRRAELTQIQSSLQGSPDWELVKKVGHQIKGNASTFGFVNLTEFGKSLEAVAAKADLVKARDLSAELESEVERLLKELSAPTESE